MFRWLEESSVEIHACDTLTHLTPQRATTSQSKGGILSKACDYIRELRQSNQRLQESYKEVERVEMDNELLRQQVNIFVETRHSLWAEFISVLRGGKKYVKVQVWA